uniref:Uncharacterized protein n=1 Tax=Anguilla anguilla TaxID=7936 RepID=A0A0E9RRA5_ANGAN
MALQNRRVFVMACITVLPVYHSDYPPYKNPAHLPPLRGSVL